MSRKTNNRRPSSGGGSSIAVESRCLPLHSQRSHLPSKLAQRRHRGVSIARLPCPEIFEATPDADSFISEFGCRNQAHSEPQEPFRSSSANFPFFNALVLHLKSRLRPSFLGSITSVQSKDRLCCSNASSPVEASAKPPDAALDSNGGLSQKTVMPSASLIKSALAPIAVKYWTDGRQIIELLQLRWSARS